MKIISIVGARPQFIKAAMVSREMSKRGDIDHLILHTGQHFDRNMSEVFFEEMGIPRPDYNLQIHSLSHGAMTGQMLEAVEKVLADENPDAVLVYGDTNSTLAGALAAKKLQMKVAHVEAGLRSYDMDMPEEINRVLTDRISDLLFCPTETSYNNLIKEGFGSLPCTLVRCGDVMYDASIHYRKISSEQSDIIDRIAHRDFVLCTIHRAENTDDVRRLRSIFDGLNRIASETAIILPIHPRTKKILTDSRIEASFDLIEPVGYFDTLELLQQCQCVITDSGGLQKEAYFFRKSCLTLRDKTEWVELVERGCNVLVGSDAEIIYKAYKNLGRTSVRFDEGLYGNGKASKQIVDELERFVRESQDSG